MRSEPRIPTEPTLDELSAYFDHEVDAGTRAKIDEHLTTCAECRSRVEGLRQTANAIRALPMATPPRTFTIPAQRRQSFRWAPVGWVGGVAAALLVVVVGVTQLHFNGPGGSAATSAASGGVAAPYRQAAPAAGQTSTNDEFAAPARRLANSTTVSDPHQPSRSLELSSDAASYPTGGTMTVQVQITGLTSNQVAPVQLVLERNGYAVELPTPSHGPSGFQSSYTLSKLALSDPVAGSYTLIAIEQLPGGDGASLVVRLPITIRG